MRADLFETTDLYNLNKLFTDEHKLISVNTTKDWLKREPQTFINNYANKKAYPKQSIIGLVTISALKNS